MIDGRAIMIEAIRTIVFPAFRRVMEREGKYVSGESFRSLYEEISLNNDGTIGQIFSRESASNTTGTLWYTMYGRGAGLPPKISTIQQWEDIVKTNLNVYAIAKKIGLYGTNPASQRPDLLQKISLEVRDDLLDFFAKKYNQIIVVTLKQGFDENMKSL